MTAPHLWLPTVDVHLRMGSYGFIQRRGAVVDVGIFSVVI